MEFSDSELDLPNIETNGRPRTYFGSKFYTDEKYFFAKHGKT